MKKVKLDFVLLLFCFRRVTQMHKSGFRKNEKDYTTRMQRLHVTFGVWMCNLAHDTVIIEGCCVPLGVFFLQNKGSCCAW